jgi:hypothetical protein
MVIALADLTHQFRSVAFQGADAVRVIVVDGLAVLVNEIASTSEVHDLYIKLGIQ